MSKKHGMCYTPTWSSWRSMRKRCLDPNTNVYKNYGGRGINICDRWSVFANFLQDMGERPEGTTLDRIDNNGNYCPENCRWATLTEQCRNRRNNAWVTLNGETLCVTEWAELLGVKVSTLKERIRRGHRTVEEAFSSSVRCSVRMLEFNGETRSVAEWADLLGMKADTIHMRLHRGWSTERALSVKVRER